MKQTLPLRPEHPTKTGWLLITTLCLIGFWCLVPGLAQSQNTWTGQNTAPDLEYTSIAFGSGLFVAVANRGSNTTVVRTSPDGITWTPQRLHSAENARQYQAVAYGNGKFSGVGNGTENVLCSSDSNRLWNTVIGPSSPTKWSSLAFGMAGGNGLFVAVGEGKEVMTSPNGFTYTRRTAVSANFWTSVTYGNGLFVAVASSGTGNRVMTSPDGITWTARTAAANNDWRSVTYGNGLFVAVANAGNGNWVMTSPDGIIWTPRAAASDNEWTAVAYGNGKFVAMAAYGDYKRVMISPDGITWTGIVETKASTWSGVTYGNGKFVAVNGNYEQSMTSPDGGVTWRSHKAPSVGNVVTYGNGLFVSAGGRGVVTSPDGITWTKRESPSATGYNAITYGKTSLFSNGLFVAVGSRVITSPDGITWTNRDAPGSGRNGVTQGEGKFVAVGNNGVITSPDGITWTTRTAPPDQGSIWSSVAYGKGMFVAVGRYGSISYGDSPRLLMTSPDGITWTIRNSLSDTSQWSSIVFANGVFVAVSSRDVIRGITVMTSPDGINWTRRLPASNNEWKSVTYGNGLFVAVSNSAVNALDKMAMTSGCFLPTVSITAAPSLTISQGQTTTLTATGANTYKWSKGQTTPAISVSVTGTYSVTGTNSAGCSSTASVRVTVLANTSPTATIAGFSASRSGSPVTFTATAGNVARAYSHTLTNGSSSITAVSSSSPFSQTVVAEGTGSQSFTLTVSANGLTASATTVLTVNARPAAPYLTSVPRTLYTTNFPIPLIIFALPTSSGLDLRFFEGATNTRIDPPVIRPNQPGTFDYYATQTDNKGCVSVPAAFSLKVLEGGTLVSKPADQNVCTGSSTVLSVTATGGNLKYSWYEAHPDTPLRVSELGNDTRGGKTANLTVSNVRQTKLYYCLVIGDKGIGVAGPIKVSVRTNCRTGARVAAGEPTESLQVRVLGNPVTGGAVRVVVEGAEDQSLRLSLVDQQGRRVSERLVERAGATEHQSLPIGHQPPGLLLLRVSTPTQTQTVKVIKAD